MAARRPMGASTSLLGRWLELLRSTNGMRMPPAALGTAQPWSGYRSITTSSAIGTCSMSTWAGAYGCTCRSQYGPMDRGRSPRQVCRYWSVISRPTMSQRVSQRSRPPGEHSRCSTLLSRLGDRLAQRSAARTRGGSNRTIADCDTRSAGTSRRCATRRPHARDSRIRVKGRNSAYRISQVRRQDRRYRWGSELSESRHHRRGRTHRARWDPGARGL